MGNSSNNNICTRCIYDSSTPGISFNKKGVCNYCLQVDNLLEEFGTGSEKGEKKLDEIILQMKRSGRNKKYDCVIGVSGGTDSSYLLIKAKEWGLRPLAVHYDNTWNSAIATENIRKVTSKLDIDLYTYVVDNKEADDIFRSFFFAGVPEFDASTDIGFAQVMRLAAAKYKIKHIIEGHSFVAEGVSPMGKNYFDGKYIQDVHRKYGKYKMKTFPNMTFYHFMKWVLIYRQKFIRPLWYINYSKEKARKVLIETTGWSYYGGHHLENRAPSFLHTVYNPQKFGLDNRSWSLAAEVRTGTLQREEALKIINQPIIPDNELVEYVKKRLNLTDEEYSIAMESPKQSFRNFKTYKRRFELLRPVFYILAKFTLVPKSFYLKYCFPLPIEKK
jgi:N-acetyl sugar amidotransferase